MLNDFISEMKQYDVNHDELKKIIESLEENSFLRMKLSDVFMVYREYQTATKGKMIDSEDFVDYYAQKIHDSEMLKNSEVWVYGFDYLTPKNMTVITALMQTCKDVNVVMAYGNDEEAERRGTFEITGKVISRLKERAADVGISVRLHKISEEYKKSENSPAEVHFIEAANYYSEAETAAAYVRSLIREKNVRYRDISLICNDLETRGAIIRQVFAEYDMNMFIDKKRSLMHNPAVGYVAGLLGAASNGLRTPDVFKILKTGLTSLTQAAVEELENYVIKYKIKGSMWKKMFKRGSFEYDAEKLEEINKSRVSAVKLITTFTEGFKKAKTVQEKVIFMYGYLTDTAELPQRLEHLMFEQREVGFYDIAGETAQAWNYIVDILNQLVQVLGDEILPDETVEKVMMTGFESIEVGVLPPTADGLVLGNMQRTRNSESIRHVVVIGANEGVLPQGIRCEGLLNADEKRRLDEEYRAVCKLDELRFQEEKLAIYKNLRSASDSLWISYSASDAEGNDARPSAVFTQHRNDCKNPELEKDISNSGFDMDKVQTQGSTLKYILEEMRETCREEDLSVELREAMNWYRENETERLDTLKKGFSYSRKAERIGRDIVKKLYNCREDGIPVVSPSGLEEYSRCHFSYFADKGLRPHERRVYEIGGREIGDVYHSSIMKFCRLMTEEGVLVNSEESKWMIITEKEAADKIRYIVSEEMAAYKDGIFCKGAEENYRAERLIEICIKAAWAIVENVRESGIENMFFETGFGRDRDLPPVEISIGKGNVIIEGRIDRADLRSDEKIRIIDYKTGSESFSPEDAKMGWKLQLMVYMKAARNGMGGNPDGVFYFLISEPYINAIEKGEAASDRIKEKIAKHFSLKGLSVVNDIEGGTRTQISDQEFEKFSQQVDEVIKKLCTDLSEGNIDVLPKKYKDKDACRYCRFAGICLKGLQN